MAKNLIVTPKGIAVFPKLSEPDTKFKPEGEYTIKVKLPLNDQETQDLIGKLKTAFDAAPAEMARRDSKLVGKKLKRANLPYVIDEEEGTVTVTAKMKASGGGGTTGKKPWTRTPNVFDALKRRLDMKEVRVGGGSIVRVCFEPSAYFTAAVGCGVTLRLEAVQVIEVKTFGGGNAESFGFGEEEGDDIAPSPPAKTEAAEESTDDETGSDF